MTASMYEGQFSLTAVDMFMCCQMSDLTHQAHTVQPTGVVNKDLNFIAAKAESRETGQQQL